HFGGGFATGQPEINRMFLKGFVVMFVFHLTVDVVPPFPCPSNRSNPTRAIFSDSLLFPFSFSIAYHFPHETFRPDPLRHPLHRLLF
ncbi:MAG TPA: hypothetical protein VGJ73_05300, partial [Verrucomicrobiae bacterium]